MKFSKSIILGALMLLISATVVAQGQRGERRGFDLEKMTEQLDLTAEQASQLKIIHEEQRAAFAKLAKGLPEGERPDREKTRALMQESRKKMMDVLSAEQIEKLKAERQNHKGGGKGKHRSKMNEELRSDLRAYRSNTIIPTFVEVRTNFDKKLIATERSQISTLREAVRSELGEQGLKRMTERGGSSKGKHHGARKAHSSNESGAQAEGKVASRDEQRGKMREFMEAHKAEVKAVREIVKNHQSELAEVRTELDAAKLKWKQDADVIRAKHMTAEQLEQYKSHQAKRGEHHKKGNGAAKRPEREGSFDRADRGAFMFLLMDPSTMEAEGFEELASEKLSVYPNPAADQTTLKFEVRSAGPVRVELIDVSGKVIKTVLEADKEAKTYELPVTLPSSMGKTGLFRVTDVKGVRTIQVTKS